VVGGRSFVPGIAGSIQGGDFGSMVDSPSGDVTAPVWAADLTLPSPAPDTSTSGCEPADFDGMPRGAIVLIQLGTCATFGKWINAEAAGAGAIVYFNEGTRNRMTAPWRLASGIPGFSRTPIAAAQVATAAALANGVAHGLTGLTARFRIDWRPGIYPTRNVIAETPGGDPGKVVVVGAHLDSVGTGPGINDNGSGSAAILEIAEQLRGVTPRNKVRFVWFGAEETFLDGSTAYVRGLSGAEQGRIAAMLNFDMIGSPNFGRFVYDGDGSHTPRPAGGAPPFSAAIERLFTDYFAARGLATRPTAIDDRSDHWPFVAAGIPAGGLFAGAGGRKTVEEALAFGGEAGRPYDPCYHLGCDDLSNVSRTALEQMADAAAHATIRLAQSRRLPARTAAPAPARRGAALSSSRDRRIARAARA